jgi:exopolysaccharide biosynthesis polyprenyl glycosylphosphotransferase
VVGEDVPAGRPRTRRTWPALVLDTLLALVVAATAIALDAVPAPLAIAAAGGWVALLVASGHYRRPLVGHTRGTRLRAVARTGAQVAVLALALAPWLAVAEPVALAGLTVALAAVSAVRLLLDAGAQRPRVVLAGRPRDVREALTELAAAGRHEVVAACLTRSSKEPMGELPTHVGFASAPEVAELYGADAVVVLPGARLSAAEVRRLHWALSGIGTELCVGTGLIDVTPGRARVVTSAGLSLVHVVPTALRGPRRWVKEVVERSAATVGLLLLAPVLAVLCLVIRLDSPGPAVYRQARVGRDGRIFTMYKLRSMSMTADAQRAGLAEVNEADGVLFKMQQDPRVTRLGSWLRKYSLDELPQLWNVVRGDMSLVGPRPALPDEVERYDTDPRRRLVVKPGCTGLWQVSGRSDLTWAQSVRLDLRYVDNWSLRLDLLILLRTISAVVTHRGAY